ncbi:rhomboid family intramembrane serine protease [Leuconostoc gelidum]|uniref:rhomboid family intramembrane serine protease n=1 Tax=Leuconostoc gelidum TaxID=1244 RepID=UPI001C7E0BB0|nr:rhomboid family intramembrane serine protease [Leuconostoc gelidum]MBZ6010652.1 rhomboid family intramembrane serine protease [Leuconostoc gelidum subsp. aenigmaticum]
MLSTLKQQFKNTPVTTSIFVLTVLVFFVEFLIGRGQTDDGSLLVAFGAKWGPYIKVYDQYWRLVTPIFLHAGVMHILTNMLTLWFIGPIAEETFGSRKFLGLYLFGGIVGNIMSYLFAPLTVSVGASSALFGMFGGLILYAVQFKHDPRIRAQGTMMGLFVVLNLMSGFFSTGIDMWGHIGGLIGGMMFAVMFGFYGRSGKYPMAWRLTMAVVTVLILALALIAKGGVS